MKRRDREPDEHADGLFALPATAGSPTTGASGASTTNFRNVSACNRCRNRKNRCDQKLPKCTNCEKANVSCVGFDPVSKREIPRSYVYYLETRVNNLEALLEANGITFPPPADDFPISDAIKPGINVPYPIQDEEASPDRSMRPLLLDTRPLLDPALKDHDDETKLNKLVDNIGMVSVHGSSDPRYGPSASASGTGISFANVVYAAVKRTKGQTPTPSERGGSKSSKPLHPEASAGSSTVRDSFFGLGCRPTVRPAPFPDKALGRQLADMYFEHANPQIPVLHRGEFMSLFERVYANDPKKGTPRELYLLNIVFAVGSGTIMASGSTEQNMAMVQTMMDEPDVPGKKRQRTGAQQYHPEEYHSSAIIHLEGFLGSSPSTEAVSGGLEELQAVCLLASLALLRPVAPGLWYIIGVAVRLSIDLGLHFEDVDLELDTYAFHPDVAGPTPSALGRKQWTRDLRRRLWWCVFNLDRLVSSCVGRPVSIFEGLVTTEFPSMLDDKYITPSGFLKPPNTIEVPSYKFVTQHYLRLRLLQSEVLQVFQHRQADSARRMGANDTNWFIIPNLRSAFLQRFRSFRDWRADIDRRLWEWKESAPQQFDTGVGFTPLFLDLNYWQAVIMLYRQSLSVPAPLASELSPATGTDVQSPGALNEEREEDQQMVFLKVAQAGQTVLKIYRQLHRQKRVNYTFLATHHLFMSGISFLYAIWHSTLVRSQLTIDDVDFTILAATSVLTDLSEKCQPAEACKEAFVRMSKATISMVMSTTGFGMSSTLGAQRLSDPETLLGSPASDDPDPPATATVPSAAPPSLGKELPKFSDLKDLFSDEELAHRPVGHPQRLHDFRTGGANHSTSRPPPTAPAHDQDDDLASLASYPTNATAVAASPSIYDSAFAGAAGPSAHDFMLDDLDFLTDFSVADPGGAATAGANLWDAANTSLVFNSNPSNVPGSGFDTSGAYDASGELFDTFFFGNNGSG